MKEILSKDYKVYFGTESLTQLSEFLIEKSYSKVFILVDNHTKKHCLPILKPFFAHFQLIEIKAGELHKNIETLQYIWLQLQVNKAERSSLFINLGGGVISDIGGFAAATFKRGIDFVNVPTTLLGMVDASIGGKLGIDLLGIKNEIGLFKHPKLIVVNPIFLETLPKDELLSGFAEMVKHSLIADKKLWNNLQNVSNLTVKNLTPFIYQSIKIKVNIVSKDPTEKNLRKALNFGHTIGHALETASLLSAQKTLLHGHAIALGMLAEAWLSKELGYLSHKEFEQINSFISTYFNLLHFAPNFDELHSLMKHDKKIKDGEIQFSLIKKIGTPKLQINCDVNLIKESIANCVSTNVSVKL